MSAELPPITERSDLAKKAVDFAAKRGWLPDWLVRALQGSAGGILGFVALAFFGPLGDTPTPAPTEARPEAGKFYTEDEISTMRAAYEMAGQRRAFIDMQESLAAERIESTRFIIKDLLEKAQ